MLHAVPAVIVALGAALLARHRARFQDGPQNLGIRFGQAGDD
jgi:hypothetical protein